MPIDLKDPYWETWQPASGHPGGWRVVKGFSPVEELCGKTGRRLIFKTRAAAELRADRLNGTKK